MKRLLLTLLLIVPLLDVASALAGGYVVGGAFRHTYNQAERTNCGSPVAAVTWTDPWHGHQQFAHCTLKAHLWRVVTSTPTPRPLPTSTPILWPTPVPTSTPVPSNDPVQQLLALLNQDRAAYGDTQSLSLMSDATTQQHAADMAGDQTIWHQSPAHPSESFPYDSFMGENVGAGQSVQQLDQLMMNEGTSTCRQGTVSHACNIVNPSFRYVAIGIAYGPPYGIYLVEDFR